MKFRASYARSVRTPTQSDLFDPLGQNFAFISDPCDTLFISGGPNRAANCAAAGVPVGFVNTPARSATLSFEQGGNDLLTAEKSDSYTVGLVLEPSFAPGLSLTLDYYDITVNDLIATLGAQQIINLCYDSADFAGNPYCPLVYRQANSEFADPAVTAGPVNFAKQKTSGIDIDLAYNHTFDNGDRLNYRIIGSWVRARSNFTDPTNPAFANRIKSELGDPAFEVGANVSYRTGDFTLRYEFRYIGPQTIGTYEAQNPFQGRPPTNADQFPQIYYEAVTYHDIRASFNVTDKMNFYIGMDNVLDKKPPFNLLGTGAGSAIFDATGRYMYAGFRADF